MCTGLWKAEACQPASTGSKPSPGQTVCPLVFGEPDLSIKVAQGHGSDVNAFALIVNETSLTCVRLRSRLVKSPCEVALIKSVSFMKLVRDACGQASVVATGSHGSFMVNHPHFRILRNTLGASKY